ncbi:sugar transporter permease [Labrys miyagiensis]|uniref:Sugar transporter permease n=1 Tax=Labrys miyagiensis TaxID=346912 RepID=A0ABQ6CHL3_9HYPH|nr:sugar transporter permease [Labrys miyagiensis]
MLCVLLGAIAVVLVLFAPNFFKIQNGINIIVQASTLGILAIGMAFVMIGGGIDLSMPANMALAAVLGAMYMAAGFNPLVGTLVMIVSGIAIGLLNGFAVAYLRMIPFVVTLAMLTVVTGVTIWVTNSVSVAVNSDAFYSVFLASLYRIPVSVAVLIVCGTIATAIMSATVYGRWLYAVGINREAARVARVPIQVVMGASYAFAGLMAGLTAVLLTARLGSASAAMGSDGVVLDTISACVVGGISIYGGVGRPLGAIIGAILITLISNALNMLGVSYYFSLMIKGAVIVLFIFADNYAKAR